jgi:hypothetical protein
MLVQASGETLDLKAYEADMRHLIDTYIKADGARTISDFEGIGLLDLIVKNGIAAAIDGLPPGIKRDRGAVAETIANNIRSKIIKEQINDPAFYEALSALLNDVLADLRAKRISYEEFLEKIADLATKVQSGKADSTPGTGRPAPGLLRSKEAIGLGYPRDRGKPYGPTMKRLTGAAIFAALTIVTLHRLLCWSIMPLLKTRIQAAARYWRGAHRSERRSPALWPGTRSQVCAFHLASRKTSSS